MPHRLSPNKKRFSNAVEYGFVVSHEKAWKEKLEVIEEIWKNFEIVLTPIIR